MTELEILKQEVERLKEQITTLSDPLPVGAVVCVPEKASIPPNYCRFTPGEIFAYISAPDLATALGYTSADICKFPSLADLNIGDSLPVGATLFKATNSKLTDTNWIQVGDGTTSDDKDVKQVVKALQNTQDVFIKVDGTVTKMDPAINNHSIILPKQDITINTPPMVPLSSMTFNSRGFTNATTPYGSRTASVNCTGKDISVSSTERKSHIFVYGDFDNRMGDDDFRALAFSGINSTLTYAEDTISINPHAGTESDCYPKNIALKTIIKGKQENNCKMCYIIKFKR